MARYTEEKQLVTSAAVDTKIRDVFSFEKSVDADVYKLENSKEVKVLDEKDKISYEVEPNTALHKALGQVIVRGILRGERVKSVEELLAVKAENLVSSVNTDATILLNLGGVNEEVRQAIHLTYPEQLVGREVKLDSDLHKVMEKIILNRAQEGIAGGGNVDKIGRDHTQHRS